MRRFLSLFVTFLFTLYGVGQVTFKVNAPNRIDINGQIRLQFELNGAEGSNFQQPSLADFDVLAGPNVSTSNSIVIINGRTKTSASTIYTYILAPKHNGTLQVGSASIQARGKVYKTNPLKIQVSGKSSPNANSSAASSRGVQDVPNYGSHIGAKDVYFTAEASKQRIYEQEPIILSYRYHIREGVAVVNIMPSGKPDMKGFWTQEIELPRNLHPEAASIGGKLYRVGTNLQYLIFPQQSGKLTIPALPFDCAIEQRSTGIDEIDAFFNGGGSMKVDLQRSAPAVSIEVLPLPQPQPADFSGGVGQLSISASLITPMPKTNDVATLRVVVRGTGNLKLVKTPVVDFPKGFDTYSPKTNDKVRITPGGIDGSMEFDYTFVPRNIGKFTIPPIKLVYFDPQTKQYVTTNTQALTLNIEKGTKAYAPISSANTEDIKPIVINNGETFSDDGVLWIGSWSYWCLLLLSFVVCAFASRYVHKLWLAHSDLEGKTVKRASKKAHKRLRQAESLLHSPDTSKFYDVLSAAITDYLAEKLKQDRAALTQEVIKQQLALLGAEDELIEQTITLLSDIDFGRFAPTTDHARHELYQRANELLHSLNDVIR